MITLSISLPSFAADDQGAWPHLFAQARAADEGGIDRLVVSDHVVYGENLDAYSRPEVGGQAGGKQPTGPDGHWLDPLVVLSAVSSVTTRTRLGTNILIAALRRPVVLAKQLATLDVLSGGRVDLGVGVGWQREEYEAAGLEFDGRGKLLNHTIEVCQTLWREPVASYDSPLLHFERIHQMPKPRQAGGVPVWVSGTMNKMVARRLARYGTGWILWGDAAADPAPAIAEMRRALADEGRDPEGVGVSGPLRVARDGDGKVDLTTTMAAIPPLVEAGQTDFRGAIPVPAGADATEVYAEFVAAFRKATS